MRSNEVDIAQDGMAVWEKRIESGGDENDPENNEPFDANSDNEGSTNEKYLADPYDADDEVDDHDDMDVSDEDDHLNTMDFSSENSAEETGSDGRGPDSLYGIPSDAENWVSDEGQEVKAPDGHQNSPEAGPVPPEASPEHPGPAASSSSSSKIPLAKVLTLAKIFKDAFKPP